jgi:hypothetical protein
MAGGILSYVSLEITASTSVWDYPMSFVAIPRTAPRHAAFHARRERLLRWISNGVTVLAAAIAILAFAGATVVLGMD